MAVPNLIKLCARLPNRIVINGLRKKESEFFELNAKETKNQTCAEPAATADNNPTTLRSNSSLVEKLEWITVNQAIRTILWVRSLPKQQNKKRH
jgi:hypothetical protein